MRSRSLWFRERDVLPVHVFGNAICNEHFQYRDNHFRSAFFCCKYVCDQTTKMYPQDVLSNSKRNSTNLCTFLVNKEAYMITRMRPKHNNVFVWGNQPPRPQTYEINFQFQYEKKEADIDLLNLVNICAIQLLFWPLRNISVHRSAWWWHGTRTRTTISLMCGIKGPGPCLKNSHVALSALCFSASTIKYALNFYLPLERSQYLCTYFRLEVLWMSESDAIS